MADVSMLMLVNYLVCSVAWMAHGGLTGDAFVLWSNVFGTVVAVVSIAQKRYFDRKS
jgi:MtN3 and saliva related transmembrane protein